MSVELTEEQVAICEMAESVARNRLASFVEKWDAEKTMPMETLRVAAALGFRRVAVRETVGRQVGQYGRIDGRQSKAQDLSLGEALLARRSQDRSYRRQRFRSLAPL
jgi:hypothetical protein